jgi:hypothetical protein
MPINVNTARKGAATKTPLTAHLVTLALAVGLGAWCAASALAQPQSPASLDQTRWDELVNVSFPNRKSM